MIRRHIMQSDASHNASTRSLFGYDAPVLSSFVQYSTRSSSLLLSADLHTHTGGSNQVVEKRSRSPRVSTNMPSSSLRPSTKINRDQTPARTKKKSTGEPDQKTHRRPSSIIPKTPIDQITNSSPRSLNKDDPSPAKGVGGKSLVSVSSRVGRMATRSSIKSLQSQLSDSNSLSSSPATEQVTHIEASSTQTSEEESAMMVLTASSGSRSSATLPSRRSNIPISRPISTISLSANSSIRAPKFAHRRSISLAVASPSPSALERSDDSALPSQHPEPPLTATTPNSIRQSESPFHESPLKAAIPTPSGTTSNVKLSSPSKMTTTSKTPTTPSPVKASRILAKSLAPKTSSSGRPSSISGSLAFSAVKKEPYRPNPRNQSIPILKKGHRPSLSTSTIQSNSVVTSGRKRPNSMAITMTSTTITNKPHSVSSPGKLFRGLEKTDVERTLVEEVDSEDSADAVDIPSPVARKVSVMEKTRKVMPKSPLKKLTEDQVDCSSSHSTDRPLSSLHASIQSSSSQMLKDLLTPSATPSGSRIRPRPLVARNSLVHFESMARSFALDDGDNSLLHLPGDGPDSSFPDLSGPDLESPPGSLRRKAKKRSSLAIPTNLPDHAELVSLQNKLDESLLAQAALNELLEREIGKVRELEEHIAEREIEEDLLKASPVKASAPMLSRPLLGKPTAEITVTAMEESDLKLKVEVARLKTELESSTDCIEHLQTGLHDLTEQLASARKNVSSLQDDLALVQSKNLELETESVSKAADLDAQHIANTVKGRQNASRLWADVKTRAHGELEDLKGDRDLLAMLETSIRMLERDVRS